MIQTTLPKMNMDRSETGCCPRFDPTDWDGAEIGFEERLFVREKTVSFLHIPLNMGSALKRAFERILAAEAAAEEEYLILSLDTSPWRGEHFIAVTKEVLDAEMAKISGTFVAKVFEGPYSQCRNWCGEMGRYIESRGETLQKLYFFYTTCPKCVKKLGKNYVVALAQVADSTGP